MDVAGARILAARIRAGVRIGEIIELAQESSTKPDLKRGDHGRVVGLTPQGNMLVKWNGGPSEEFDPTSESFTPVLSRVARAA